VQRGLFLGLLVFVFAVISLVIFYVLENSPTSLILSSLMSHYSESIIYVTALLATCLAAWRMKHMRYFTVNPITASCENAMSLSVPGVSAPCVKFPHFSQLNFE
jgi:hypothetical protein